MPTVSNLEMKALEVVSTFKQKFYILNQKKLKLTKNPIVTLLEKKLIKLFFIFYKIISLFLEKKYEVALHLVVVGF